MSDVMDDPWSALDAPADRTPRTLETRQTSERARVWQPSSILPDPEPQDGWVFRWCVAEIRSQLQNSLYQKRLREGWEPVNAEDHPEMMMSVGLGDDKRRGLVEVGGLILCKMPAEMAEQRRRYYYDRTVAATDSAENSYLRDNDERMKKVAEKRRQIVFGQRGR